MIIQTEGGDKLQIPDGTTPDGIDDVLQHYQSQQSYLSRTGNDVSTALNKGANILQNSGSSNLNPVSSALQTAGSAADAVYAPMTEATKSAYNALPASITAPINSMASSAASGVKSAYNSGVDALADTDAGKTAGDWLMNSPRAQQNMQEVSDDAKAAAKLLMISPTGEVTEAATRTVGDPLYQSGKAAQQAANDAYVQKLVLPKETPTQMAQNALRTKQIDGVNTYQPTPYEKAMAGHVGSIDGISPSNSIQKNLGLVQDANAQEALALKSKLQTANVPIPDATVVQNLQTIRNTLPQSTTISAPGEMTIERVVNSGLNHITNNDQTAAGMLQARKDFDAQMIKERGEGVFDPSIETPRSTAISAVRNSMNGMIADAVPSADVKASLAKQNALYTASDNIATKAASEAATPVQRFIAKYSPHGMMGVTGAAVADAAAHAGFLTPTTAAIGAGAYGGYKLATSPLTRVAIGKALGGQ